MMWLTVTLLTWLCNPRRPPAWGAQASSCFFPASKDSGKFRFLACSGDREPLVMYALTYPSFPLQATKRSEKKKTNKALDKIFTFISVLGEWILKLFRIQRIEPSSLPWSLVGKSNWSAWTSKKTENLDYLEKKLLRTSWKWILRAMLDIRGFMSSS